MNEYTKGDWRASRPKVSNGWWVVKSGKIEIATLYQSTKVNQSNAKLIASTPGLYEALKAIINSETIKDRGNFNKALEALAKAISIKLRLVASWSGSQSISLISRYLKTTSLELWPAPYRIVHSQGLAGLQYTH